MPGYFFVDTMAEQRQWAERSWSKFDRSRSWEELGMQRVIGRDRKWWVVIAMALTTLLMTIDFNGLTVALPTIGRDLSTSTTGLQWTINAYLLALAAPSVAAGRLADIFGRRRVLLIGTVVFIVGSAASGLAEADWWLIGARRAGYRCRGILEDLALDRKQHVRVSLVEPGAVATELQHHLRDEIREQAAARFADMEILQSEDIADAVAYIVTRPRHVAINEALIRRPSRGLQRGFEPLCKLASISALQLVSFLFLPTAAGRGRRRGG